VIVARIGVALGLSAIASAQVNVKHIEFFEAKIRPILVNKCYSCHTDNKLGGLRVDSRAGLLEGGKRGPAIVPGAPDRGLLLPAVMQVDEKLKMPLSGGKLKEDEIADLRYWIQIGAPWPHVELADQSGRKLEGAPAESKGFRIRPDQKTFWAFQPLKRGPPPEVKDKTWATGAIDLFVMAKLEEKNLKPVPQADKLALIRRATFDLTGLPPTPEQVDAFINDTSPDAFAKVVDRLLESPHYGERWARHWLDVARYADGGGRGPGAVGAVNLRSFLGYGMTRDGFAATWRYRDWVIQAINEDLPYDQFVRAQIAADLMPAKDREKLLPGLGFFGLGPWFTGDDVIFSEARANERDDKVDALSKGFLGLTVTCARCHDHKYDPLSQKDYTALAGIFASSGFKEYILSPPEAVDRYRGQHARLKAKAEEIEEFAEVCGYRIGASLAAEIPQYMLAVRKAVLSNPKPDLKTLAAAEKLNPELLERWFVYLTEAEKQHNYVKPWDTLMANGGGTEAEARRVAEEFKTLVLSVIAEQKEINEFNRDLKRNRRPEPNELTVQLPGDLVQFELFQFKQQLVQKVPETTRYYVWIDIVDGPTEDPENYPDREAIFQYATARQNIEKFMTVAEKAKIGAMQQELAALQKVVPPTYDFLMGLEDTAATNLKLAVRGNVQNPGPEVHRGFPAILGGTDGEPLPFTKGSGRLELAEAIVRHPLSARVMANRIWMHHFGRGIVDSPSNFGTLGERPSHPELLDYLASRLIENKWSIKSLHREIMLSSTYQLGAKPSKANSEADPDNRLLWRANLRRLEVESLRDALLFVTGTLDERLGGPAQDVENAENKKRTVYARVGRAPSRMLALFDFPEPTVSGEQRTVTNVPTQSLFLLNSDMMMRQAEAFVKRLGVSDKDGDAENIQNIHRAYRILYGRQARETELNIGVNFLKQNRADGAELPAWTQYAQALLSAGEFYYVN
jgi:hypothetical protein